MGCCGGSKIKVGDKVRYRDLSGEVTMLLGDGMVLVKMPDNKEYTYQEESLVVESSPISINNIAKTFIPHLKNMEFLDRVSKEIHTVGITELVFRNGSYQITSKETLEEKINRHRAEALAIAEAKARDEYEKENSK